MTRQIATTDAIDFLALEAEARRMRAKAFMAAGSAIGRAVSRAFAKVIQLGQTGKTAHG